MTIAVHIAIPDEQKDIRKNFSYHCFIILAAKHPDHHFIFIFDKPFDPSIITKKNITPVLLGPQIKNRLLQHYFYNFKIPRLLNKYHADLFVCAGVCSLRTNVPQYLILHDLSFLQKKNLFAKNDIRYLKRYTKSFVKKAAGIATLNTWLRRSLTDVYAVNEAKISVIDIGIDHGLKPYSFEEAEEVRNSLTEGKQYFVFFATAAAEANIITMLKAFSIFKKWQKSNMQLVILFPAQEKEDAIKGLSSYKYRADVKITALSGNGSAGIIASAYAAIQLAAMEITETEGLQALACAVPLITTNTDFSKSIYKDGALYALPGEKDISEKMMLLYKDEQTRNNLSIKGNAVAAAHTWQNAADQLWLIIQAGTA